MKSPYTKPIVRKRIVAEVMAGSKGGPAGKWTARKAQLARRLYEEAGGGYRGQKTAQQKKLTVWTGQNWTTRTGDVAASRDSKGRPIMRRYLPADVWEALSESEARATDRKKVKGSKQGRGNVPNTRKVRKLRRKR